MFELQALQINPKKILARLWDFEAFCLGKKNFPPDHIKKLNTELSIGAVLHVGKRRFSRNTDGKHLMWTGADNREHDLGPIHKFNVMKDYPGFHKGRTLSLMKEANPQSDVIDVPGSKKQISIVKLADGSVGVGPNYRIALRNAVLKMQLKSVIRRTKQKDAWSEFCDNI